MRFRSTFLSTLKLLRKKSYVVLKEIRVYTSLKNIKFRNLHMQHAINCYACKLHIWHIFNCISVMHSIATLAYPTWILLRHLHIRHWEGKYSSLFHKHLIWLYINPLKPLIIQNTFNDYISAKYENKLFLINIKKTAYVNSILKYYQTSVRSIVLFLLDSN